MIAALLWVRLLFLAFCGGLVAFYVWLAYRTRQVK
jgi:hypothetical protein